MGQAFAKSGDKGDHIAKPFVSTSYPESKSYQRQNKRFSDAIFIPYFLFFLEKRLTPVKGNLGESLILVIEFLHEVKIKLLLTIIFNFNQKHRISLKSANFYQILGIIDDL